MKGLELQSFFFVLSVNCLSPCSNDFYLLSVLVTGFPDTGSEVKYSQHFPTPKMLANEVNGCTLLYSCNGQNHW